MKEIADIWRSLQSQNSTKEDQIVLYKRLLELQIEELQVEGLIAFINQKIKETISKKSKREIKY